MTVKDVLEKFDIKNSDVNEVDLIDIHELTTYQYNRFTCSDSDIISGIDIKPAIDNFGSHEVSNIRIDNDDGVISLEISFM